MLTWTQPKYLIVHRYETYDIEDQYRDGLVQDCHNSIA